VIACWRDLAAAYALIQWSYELPLNESYAEKKIHTAIGSSKYLNDIDLEYTQTGESIN
jgi:hypothetical protein